MQARTSCRLRAILLIAALAALPSSVLASGFQLVEQNASGLGNAFAGQAAGIQNAGAIYFNPAALTRVPGSNFVVSVEPIGLGTTFVDSGSTPPSLGGLTFPVPLGTDGGDAGKWTPVPNGYFSAQMGDKAWIGIGFNVPFGLETEWTSDWIGRFHGIHSKIQTYNVNPTLAFKLSDGFSIGAGVSWQHLTAELSQNVAYGGISYVGGIAAGTAAGGPAVGAAAGAAILAQLGGQAGLALEGPALIKGDSNAWGWNVGALLKLGEQGHLGVSYRSKIKHEIDGTATFTGAPSFSLPGGLAPIGAGLNARFADGPVTAKVDLPDTFSAALAAQGQKVEVLADWTWTGWSSIQSLDIVRTDGSALSSVTLKFRDTWRAGLGVNIQMNDVWKLRLGTAYDKSPVEDVYRTPRLPDTNRVWAAGGFEWKVAKKALVDVGYAHLFIKDSSSDLPNQETATSTPMGALVGSYHAKVDILGAQLTLSF
jgi:long-chain fatty acid transport protein